jgi:hypothetical protein
VGGAAAEETAAEGVAAGGAAAADAAVDAAAGGGREESCHRQRSHDAANVSAVLSHEAGAVFGVLESFLRAQGTTASGVSTLAEIPSFCCNGPELYHGLLLQLRLAQAGPEQQQVAFVNLLVTLLKLTASPQCSWGSRARVKIVGGALDVLQQLSHDVVGQYEVPMGGGLVIVVRTRRSEDESWKAAAAAATTAAAAAATHRPPCGYCCWVAAACSGQLSWRRCRQEVQTWHSLSSRLKSVSAQQQLFLQHLWPMW